MENKKIFANISWIMIGRVVQLGLTFVTTMLVSRYLGPAEYGKITYVYSYIQLFLPLCTLGMNDIAVKELVDDPEHNDEVLGSMIGIRALASLLAMFCSVGLVSILTDSKAHQVIAVLLSFSLLFQSIDGIMYFYQSKLLSKKSGSAYALAYIVSSLYRVIGILLHKDTRWFAFAVSFDFLMTAILLLSIYFHDHYRLRFSFKRAGSLLSHSRHYIFAGLLVVIYGKVTDVLLLGKMIDETNVGYYSAATTLCNAWPFVLTAIIDSFNPLIVEAYAGDQDEFYVRIRKLYALVFYISTFAAVMITLFADLAIRIVYGSAYMPAAASMKIYAWSTAFSYLGVARTSWMQCKGLTRYETMISLFGAASSITANYFLIRSFGITGAALAAVLTQFLTNFAFLFFVKDIRENAKLILDAILLRGVLDRRGDANV